MILYHKNINKELQERIDGLLAVNRELKEKVATLSSNTNNQSETQFYKDQASQLESEIAQLKKRAKDMTDERKSGKSELDEYKNELSIMISKNAELEKKVNELKSTIRSLEAAKAQV